MARKRSLTFHQKQVRFFTILFGCCGVAGVVAVMVLVNYLPGPGR